MKKFVLGCLAVAGIFIAILAAAVGYWMSHRSPPLATTISVPPEVELGATVTMIVTASNPHNQPVTLDSIDIDEGFLAGFQVVSVEPRPASASHIPIAEQRSWDFGQSVPPGGSVSVTFTLRPVAEGRFTGDVDVCNPSLDWTTAVADVIVTAKRTGGPTPQTPPKQPAPPGATPRSRR